MQGSKDSGLELDFLVRFRGECVILEVKAKSGKAKSMTTALKNKDIYFFSVIRQWPFGIIPPQFFHRRCVHSQPYGSSLIFLASKSAYCPVIAPSVSDSGLIHTGRHDIL